MRISTLFFLLLFISFSGLEAEAKNSWPQPKLIWKPASNPTLPPEMQTFAPGLNGLTVSELTAPQVAEWTRSAKPDETIAVSGWQVINLMNNPQGDDVCFSFFGQTTQEDAVWAQGTLQSLENDTALVTLPDNLPTNSAYLMWISNESGISYPERINMAETWWLGPEKAAVGDSIWIFGQNLMLAEHSSAWVYVEAVNGGTRRWLTTKPFPNSNPYRLELELPSDLSQGSYNVWVHNGGGGAYGWSAPLSIEINNGFPWSESMHVVTSYGAVGDGIHDDTQAINSAFSNANNDPWSTVYFPAGTYLVSDKIIIGNQIRLLGVDSVSSVIRAIDGFDAQFMLDYNGNQIEMAQLGIDANALNKVRMDKAIYMRGHDDLKVLDCRWDVRGTKDPPVDIHDCRRVLFKNLESIQSSHYFLGNSGQIFFEDCQFYGSGGHCTGLLGGFGTHEISISGSTANHYGVLVDDSDPDNPKEPAYFYKGRFFFDQPHWGNPEHHYFGENTFLNACPPLFNHHQWRTQQVGNSAANGSVLYAWGNLGNMYDTEKISKSPRARYPVQFTQTGTHYIWVRGRGTLLNDMADAKVIDSDSCYLGLNGLPLEAVSIDRVSDINDPNAFIWQNMTKDNVIATLDVPSIGMHDLDLYVFEDGFECDKLLLTTNPNYIPTGEGPIETIDGSTYIQQNTPNGLLVLEAENANELKNGDNHTFNIDQNSGEQIMWESNRHVSSNYVVDTASDTSITLAGDFGPDSANKISSVNIILIVNGKGLGQSRSISSVDLVPNTGSSQTLITISEPWNVTPDSSSEIVIMRAIRRAVVYDNFCDATERCWAGEAHVASAGVQTYKGGVEVILANNVFQELRSGISLWITDPDGCKPIFSWLCKDNQFNNVRQSIGFWNALDCMQPHMIFSNVFRGNTFDTTPLPIMRFRWQSHSQPGYDVDAFIFEHNQISNAPGIATFSSSNDSPIFKPVGNALFYKNTATLGTAEFSGSSLFEVSPTIFEVQPLLQENTFTGFESLIIGPLSAPSALDSDNADDGFPTGNTTHTFTWQAPASSAAIIGYSYALNAIPDDIVDSARGTTTFSDLAPGNYTFQVKAITDSGISEVATFNLIIDSNLIIPTMTQWGIVILVALMILFALRQLQANTAERG